MKKKEKLKGLTDSELVQRMQKGDTEAFSILYHRHAPKLLNFVSGLIKDQATAEDVVQNVFVRLWSVKGQLDPSKSLTNWLFVCARNESFNIHKSAWHSAVDKNAEPSAAMLASEDPSDLYDIWTRLADLISDMPERRKEIWRMSREQHLSNAEIAARLGISIRTVEKHIELALKEIRSGFN